MDPNCVSRKTSESHLNPTIERLTVAPPSPNPSNVDEISVKSSEIVKRNHQSKPKVSFRESLKIKRQKILNRKSSVEVAEQREKRVLIQMSVIVLAFLILYLPYWTLMLVMHTCHFFQVFNAPLLSNKHTHHINGHRINAQFLINVPHQAQYFINAHVYMTIVFLQIGAFFQTVSPLMLQSIQSILQWLGYTNSLVNPIIYTVFNRDFRLAFLEIFTGKFT